MKTKVWKRIGALVLALALIVSGVPQMCIEALAESTGSEFSITEFQGAERVVNNTYWYFHLKHDGGFNIGDTTSFCSDPVYWNATIDDGTGEKDATLQLYDSGTDTIRMQVYYATIPTDGTANCKVVLKAGTCTSNSGNYINTLREDVTLYFNEYGISLNEPIAEVESSGIYAKSVWVHAACDRRAIYWDMSNSDVFADSAKLLAANDSVEGKWYYPNETSGIWIDDQYYEPDSNHVNPGFVKFRASTNSYYISLWNVQSKFSAGSKLTLEGRFVVGDQAVYMDKSVFQWVVPAGVEDSQEAGRWVILPRLLELAEGTTTENGVWEIHMSYLGELLGNDGETFTAKAVVGEEEIEVKIYSDGSNIVIEPPAEKVPTDGSEVTMTLKAGDITGSAGSTSMIVNDVTFCINEYGLALDEYITVDTEDVALTYYHVASQPNYVYMRGLIDDVFPATNSAGNLSWDIYPEPLNGIVDGVYYHEGNSGIWVNDTYYDKNGNGVGVGFVKHGMTGKPLRDYYLSSAGESGVEKEIKVQGVFRWTDDSGKTYMVEYLPSSFKWDGSKWKDASTYTVLQKDLDSKTNYSDKTWNIYMNHNGGFKGNGDKELFKWPVTIIGVDGTKTDTEIDVYATPNGDTYYFNPIIPDTVELTPETGKVELVIKAATIEGDNGTSNELKADISLFFDRYGLSVEGKSTTIEMPTSSIKLGRVSPYSWDTGIYFHTSGIDPIKGDDSWNVRPTAMGGYVNGVCYRGQGSISITQPGKEPTKYMPNSKVTGIPSFVKIGNYGSNQLIYYIGINNSETVVKGTQVKIEGLFVWDGTAVDISPTTMEWDGYEWQNITPSHDKDINLTLNTKDAILGATQNVYFDSDTTVEEIPVQGWLDPMPGDDNGVFINGIRTEIQLKKESTAQERYVAEVTNSHIELGDELSIKGRFIREGHIIEFNESVVVFDGSNWNQSVKTTYVTLGDTTEYDSATTFGFTVTPEDALEVNGVEAYTFKEGGFYLNGVYNATPSLYKLGDGLYKVELNGLEVTEGDKVVVDGIIDGTATGGAAVRVQYMYAEFMYDGNGGWILQEDSGVTYQPIRFEVKADDSYKDESGNLNLTLTAEDGLLGQPGKAEYTGLVAVVNGEGYGLTIKKNEKSYYDTVIPAGAFGNGNGNATIVIKRGVLHNGNIDAWEDNGRYVEKDLTIYVAGDYLTDKGQPQITTGVDITYSSGSATNLDFLVSGEDTMMITTTMGAKIYASDDPNSGVFADGVKKSNLVLYTYQNEDETYYRVQFDNNVYVPSAGDVVVLNGTFELANYFSTVNTVAVKWDGSTWSAITDLSNITLQDLTVDAYDTALLVDTVGTEIIPQNGNTFTTTEEGTVLYKEGTYTVKYNIGTASLTQSVTITNSYNAADKGGAGKADATLPDMKTESPNIAGNYINGVESTTHGTTVISMSENGDYVSNANTFDDYGVDYVIDMDIDRDFRVLQLADTQSMDSEQQRRSLGTLIPQMVPEKQFENMFYYIDKVVEESKPDVILIAGDVLYAEFDHNGTLMQSLIAYMDSLQIPWAPIFGNHDQESSMGVAWQCDQLRDSTYCLFNRRHDGVGGNGNFSIGLARNGVMERAIYMMDSNGCGSVEVTGSNNDFSIYGYHQDGTMSDVKAAPGFYQSQMDWYYTTARRVNAVATAAGDADGIVPSIQCYHIGTTEMLLAARASGYQYGTDTSAKIYALDNDPEAQEYLADEQVVYIAKAQEGDSGYKMGTFSNLHVARGLLEMMNRVGTNGVFTGHDHKTNVSMTYGGVRWTYGLKTGIYADDTVNKGGTLITMSQDSADFIVDQIQVELEYSEPSMTLEKNNVVVGYAGAIDEANTIYLYANTTRDAMPSQDGALVVAEDDESGIFVNAIKSNDAKIYKADAETYKIVLPKAAEIGDVVSLYGIFENGETDPETLHAVYFKKTEAVQWDGAQWNPVKTVWDTPTRVTVNATGIDCEATPNYKLSDGGFLPYTTADFPFVLNEAGEYTYDAYGNKVTNKNMLESVNSTEHYGDNVVYSKLDNVIYEKVIALYIPGDSHVDEKVDVLDLVAMKKAENGEEPTTETEKYADQLGSKGLREKLVGK